VEPIFIFKNGLKDGTTWFSKENVLAVRNEAHQVAVFMSFCNIYWQFCQYIQVQNDLAANKSLKLTANPLRLRLAVVGSLALTLCDKIKNSEMIMKTAKETVKTLLERLPDKCTIEDIQYHLYVIEKIQRSLERAEKEGAIEQEEVEKRLSKWVLK